MSHGFDQSDDDIYHLDPKDILSQYSVEWVALRKSFKEIKLQLTDLQLELTQLDKQLENGEISEQMHMERYHERWRQSTEMIQVKREVEARLSEIQREIRSANKKLQQMEVEKRRRERIEQEKAHAMIEWMSLKAGFDLVRAKKQEISVSMDTLEMKRREESISDEVFREQRMEQLRELTEIATVESDVKRRLNELLEVVRK